MKPRIDPQRWKQIDDLLDAAIDLEPEKRSSYLDQACGSDQNLRKKVEELLKSDQHAEDFISLPVLDPASEYVDHKIELYERDVIADRYELVSRLGTGGMGEVWLAFDLKLRLHVVLKTLHFHLNRASHRVEALRREVLNARTVISPNVCRIFDLVIDHDREFISMEHIDGMTLAAVLKSTGPLPLSKARDIAAQFLTGLQVIHDAGLVHCDLKPENIMITHTGRVVIMDFGIAKQMDQTRSTISGTPAYMSPEQLCGAAVDPKTDIFAAGIVLAEMIHPDRIVTDQTREEIWNRIRQDPPELADSAWKSVIARAVAVHPEDRFHSAADLLRSLEDVTELMQTQHERSPYPGLASYRTEDADYFFGREQEVEAVIKKLKELHFLALVGTSGSGKTSFLRAGLIPALPDGWNSIFCVPGDSPHLNLKDTLIREFSSDPEAMQQLSRFDEAEVAVQLLNQWRRKYTEAVLIIDRFEELFTLNGTGTQSRFADLIGAAVVHADIHVLLSMRDDFLIRCHHYPSLAPVFSGLTPLESLSGPSLRRALVQPARKSGYAFEDEILIDEILADVEKERGALPLMAFAAAQLWKKRDRDSGVLTRKAYIEIGGVGGALAQHAEKTLERIGTEKQDTVREIFRNLITVQNTRAARDIEELLSIFPDQQKAEEVLRILIDARLLTSFEEHSQDGEKPKRQVEIIHESLLAAWPRLVRWQTQEVESAQLRDQLRQASQLWEQKNRANDVLWTGTSYKEFEIWKDRYPGGLTATEQAFTNAMVQNAGKLRRKRRIAVVVMFVVLLSVLAAISNFWRNASIERDRAILEAKRAEASKVLVAGRANSSADPSARLAYALASLQLFDSTEARRFALQALSEGPVAMALRIDPALQGRVINFSPDNRWIAAGGAGKIYLLPNRTSAFQTLISSENPSVDTEPWFSPDSKFLLSQSAEDRSIWEVWSISERKVVRTIRFEGRTIAHVNGETIFFLTDVPIRFKPQWSNCVIRRWRFGDTEPKTLGHLPMADVGWQDFDSRSGLTYVKGQSVYLRSWNGSGIGPEKLLGKHPQVASSIKFHPNRKLVASTDVTGEIRIWHVDSDEKSPLRVIPSQGPLGPEMLWFDPEGHRLFAIRKNTVLQWDLSANENAEPVVFRLSDQIPHWVSFDKNSRWMAIAWDKTLTFHPLTRKYPYVFRHSENDFGTFDVRFRPNGESFVNGVLFEGIRVWNLPVEIQKTSRALWKGIPVSNPFNDMNTLGKHVISEQDGESAEEKGEFCAGSRPADPICPWNIRLISNADEKFISLKRGLSGRSYDSITFSPDRELAAVAVHGPPYVHAIEIWNLRSGSVQVLEQSKGKISFYVKYSPDGTVFSGDSAGNLYQWKLNDGSFKKWRVGDGIVTGIAITRDGRYVAVNSVSATQWFDVPDATSKTIILDLKQNKLVAITSHGDQVFRVALDPKGAKLVTGDLEGNVRVGSIIGESPHLLIGHNGPVGDVTIHPDGKWIASAGFLNPEMRLWPMPEGQPFHTLPHDELLNRLRSLTNLRVVADKNSSNGYRIDVGPFPGWEKLPNW